LSVDLKSHKNGSQEYIFTEADRINLHLLHSFNSKNVETLFQNVRRQIAIRKTRRLLNSLREAIIFQWQFRRRHRGS